MAPATVIEATFRPENPERADPVFNSKIPPEVRVPVPVRVPFRVVVPVGPIPGLFPSGKLQVLATVFPVPLRTTELKDKPLQVILALLPAKVITPPFILKVPDVYVNEEEKVVFTLDAVNVLPLMLKFPPIESS